MGNAQYRTIGGQLHKLCRGRLHPQGKFIPVSEFYKRHANDNKGKWRSVCIACDFARKGAEPRIEFTQQWQNWVDEIVYRVGVCEGMRRMEMSAAWHRWMKRHKPRKIKRSTGRKIITTLKKLRATDEVRHKDSIRHGSKMRGHKEKIPVAGRDFNGPNAYAAERRKRWSLNHPEQAAASYERSKIAKREKRQLRQESEASQVI